MKITTQNKSYLRVLKHKPLEKIKKYEICFFLYLKCLFIKCEAQFCACACKEINR